MGYYTTKRSVCARTSAVCCSRLKGVLSWLGKLGWAGQVVVAGGDTEWSHIKGTS